MADRRPSGKRGLRPSGPHPELLLSKFRSPVKIIPPPSGDVSADITDWGMLGNDTFGDCGPAATEHYRMAKAGHVNVSPAASAAYTESLYFQYGEAMGEPGPQPDEGVDNATWLAWLFQQGIIEGFAKLNHQDAEEVHQAMLDFHGVLVGCTLTDDAESEFEDHQPWNITSTEQPDPNDGHDILLVKYSPQGETFVTWGALQPATVAWDAGAVNEAWVIVTAEDATRLGVNMPALQAQIRALGGEVDALTPPHVGPPHGGWWNELLRRLRVLV